METQINSYPIHQELTFYDADKTPLGVRAIALTLTEKDGKILGCRLKFSVDEPVYQFILKNSLFNLRTEATFSVTKVEFFPEFAINLEAELRSDWLLNLDMEGKFTENIVNNLTNLEPAADIIKSYNFTENWYCLSVNQQQHAEEVGYRTFWNYLNLSQINEIVNTGDRLVESISSFVKEASKNLTSQLEITNYNSEYSTQNIDRFRELLEKIGSDVSSQPQSIYEVMKEFFDEDDWNFVELEGESVLQMAFQGDNGRWTCYACAFEESQQFVFYSVCPLAVSPERILLMAEYLMKANYGLIIGNFELDFTDGEIRYKTSIDVENEQLTTEFVNNLVQANLLTMDKYLPGITGIINGQRAVNDAIAIVENLL